MAPARRQAWGPQSYLQSFLSTDHLPGVRSILDAQFPSSSFFGGTGDGTQGLKAARQVLSHLSHVSSPLAFSLFSDRVS
jgi:hypothetical protein